MRLDRLFWCSVLVASVLLCAFPQRGEANWFTRIAREAGDAGSAGAKFGLHGLDEAARYVAKLPSAGNGLALAAHVTPEGHWKFVNREGAVFTAAGPDEMARVAQTFGAEGPQRRLMLYLHEDAVFKHREQLKNLPSGAELRLIENGQSFRLIGSGPELRAELRPNLVAALDDPQMFREAAFHTGRVLNRSAVRVVALDPKGPKTLSSIPSYDPATRAALVDAIDPAALSAALAKLKYQTLVVTGRVEGSVLHYTPRGGGERQLSIPDLTRAAEAADVNLVVLNAAETRQPGGRTWLFQTVEVAGLQDAMKRATFGDFLQALGGNRGELTVSARPSGSGRIALSVQPSGGASAPLTDAVTGWLTETAGSWMGHVAVQGIQASVPDRARAEELDLRIIPGIPSGLQIMYLVSLVCGLAGWEFSSAWWRRIWPPELREDYGMAAGYHAARVVRFLAFLLLFVPIVGFPAILATVAVQLWRTITAPFRWIGGKMRNLGGARTESRT